MENQSKFGNSLLFISFIIIVVASSLNVRIFLNSAVKKSVLSRIFSRP